MKDERSYPINALTEHTPASAETRTDHDHDLEDKSTVHGDDTPGFRVASLRAIYFMAAREIHGLGGEKLV